MGVSTENSECLPADEITPHDLIAQFFIDTLECLHIHLHNTKPHPDSASRKWSRNDWKQTYEKNSHLAMDADPGHSYRSAICADQVA